MAEVVYVTAGRWPGVLVVVTERREWGIQGYMPMPDHDPERGDVVGRAFARVSNGAFVKVGDVELLDENPSR